MAVSITESFEFQTFFVVTKALSVVKANRLETWHFISKQVR